MLRAFRIYEGILYVVVTFLCLNQAQAEVLDLSLEQLMDLEVTTASKRLQPVREIPAPITVITAEDIRRSQAEDLPELLQRVPGFFVGRAHGGLKAISARTVAERLSNKLLVLIDGRSVYTPAFSGVYWEQQHIMLENIERIEVIRGPGGALWGANAVNGIVNVITKKAADTQGALVTATAGTDRIRSAMRYGFSPSDNVNVRVYADALDEMAGYLSGGSDDDWRQSRIGTRAEGNTGDNKWSLQGEISETTQGSVGIIPDAGAQFPEYELVTDDKYTAAHLLGRIVHDCNNGDEVTLQAYWDFAQTEAVTATYRQHTFDLDLQRHMQLDDRQELVLGLGYRGIEDDFNVGNVVDANPEQRFLNWYSAFVQHELQLVDSLLTLTSGVKTEYNDYTHDEWQPSVRLAYTPRENLMAWLGWSRAARTPSRIDNDMIFNQAALNNTGDYLQLFGSDQIESEYVNAWEAGLRVLANQKLSIDVALYYHEYSDLRTFEQVGNAFPQNFQFVADNKAYGEAYGAEATVMWRPTPKQTYYLAYTYADTQYHLDSDSLDGTASESAEDKFPHHQAYLAADWQLMETVDFGINLRYIDNAVAEQLDARVHLDARVTWRPRENLEFAIIGRSLLDPSHGEYGSRPTINSQTTEERRSVTAKLTWTF